MNKLQFNEMQATAPPVSVRTGHLISRYARLADCAYEKSPACFLAHLRKAGGTPGDLEVVWYSKGPRFGEGTLAAPPEVSYKVDLQVANPFIPEHWLVVDHASRSVAIVIRGTQGTSVSDA